MTVKRAYAICAAIFALFAVLIARFAYIQIISAGSLEEAAFEQRMSNTGVEKLRGNILDRNLISFTNRNQKYIAFIKTALIPDSQSERQQVCEILGLAPDALDGLISSGKPEMIQTDEKGREAILKLDKEWVSILNSLERYEENGLAKHIIGYISRRDQIGQTGIEKAYERELKNNIVFEIGAVKDAANNTIKGLGYRAKDLSSDKQLDIKLTLDYHIQKIVEDVLDKNSISGAVVVEDILTGDILAIASMPDYDQYKIERYLDSSGNELFNKATAAYNLGSIFKLIDAAAYYENPQKDFFNENISMQDIYNAGRFYGNDMYYCEGAVNINNLIFKCSSYYEGGHGWLNMEKAFAVSCNSYFINLACRGGYSNLIDMARKFGLGGLTGISRQGIKEAAGSLPASDTFYSQADIANLSIGQGKLLATPLQVADIVATVANGGIKNKINIVDSIVDSDGNKVKNIRTKGWQRVITKETSDKLMNLMKACTEYGTGTDAVAGYYGGAGGKTGSAETGSPDVVHAWFAGYFPALEPRYSIAVFIENGHNGGKIAAPIFAEIAETMLEKGY
ncbi:MAG: penicillin-binding protein 2 [Clostridiales bacterium]|nr:penicillin-binding protein 2 [Clostridiales bacterium]